MKPKQSASDLMECEVWERLLRKGHSASNIRRSAERYFHYLDEEGEEAPTFTEFLLAYEAECEAELGTGYLLN
jgi:hypothetical protein